MHETQCNYSNLNCKTGNIQLDFWTTRPTKIFFTILRFQKFKRYFIDFCLSTTIKAFWALASFYTINKVGSSLKLNNLTNLITQWFVRFFRNRIPNSEKRGFKRRWEYKIKTDLPIIYNFHHIPFLECHITEFRSLIGVQSDHNLPSDTSGCWHHN